LEIAFASPLPVTVWEITKDGTKRERKERKKEKKIAIKVMVSWLYF